MNTNLINTLTKEITICTPDSLSIAASILNQYHIEIPSISALLALYEKTPKTEYNDKFSLLLDDLKAKAIQELISHQI